MSRAPKSGYKFASFGALWQRHLHRRTLEHPERTVIHTWTDPHNTAMYRTNERFGFRPVEVLHEMQRPL